MTFIVPLTSADHQKAQIAVTGIDAIDRKKRVYLNILSTVAVNYYLRLMGFDTDFEHSDSQDPLLQRILDTADVLIPNLGRIECTPVLPGMTEVSFSTESQGERLAYVLVQFPESLGEAEILGFMKGSEQAIAIDHVEALELFLDYLTDLEDQAFSTSSAGEPLPIWQRLGVWIEQSKTEVIQGWRNLQGNVNGQTPLEFQFLNGQDAIETQRVKVFNLGTELHQFSIVMMIALKAEEDGRIAIQVRVQPELSQAVLPPGLELALLSTEGEELNVVNSDERDSWIRLKRFRGQVGEQFQIQIRLREAGIITASMTELFMI